MGHLANLPAFAAGATYSHSDFNAAFSALTVSTAFHTTQATLSTYSTSVEVMVYDPATAAFKKGPLGSVVFSNDELLYNRTASTSPGSAYVFLAQNPADKAFYKVARENLFGGMWAFTGVLSATGGLTHTTGDSLAVNVDGTTLEISTNTLRVKDASLGLDKLTTTAKRSLAGATAVFAYQVGSGTAAESTATSDTQLGLNTTVTNTLSGCSLSSNRVTLAAGRYEVTMRVPIANGVTGYALLYNYTDNATLLTTDSTALRATGYGTFGLSHIELTGVIELSASKVIELRGKASGTGGKWGLPATMGVNETYQTLTIRQAY